MDAIAIGAAGMRAQQHVVDTLSSNIANVNTPAFKRMDPVLKTVGFSAHIRNEDDALASETETAGSTSFAAPRRLMDTGDLKKTDRPLDIAIRGSGFFVLSRADGGTVYTRNGDFRQDAEGYLVDANGFRLSSEIQIPREAQAVRIDGEGRVFAQIDGKEEITGQIELARFPAPERLAADAGGIYRTTVASGEAEVLAISEGGVGSLVQGFLEASNVKVVDEFVSLVVAQRAYEASAKMVQAADEMLSLANGLLRG